MGLVFLAFSRLVRIVAQQKQRYQYELFWMGSLVEEFASSPLLPHDNSVTPSFLPISSSTALCQPNSSLHPPPFRRKSAS